MRIALGALAFALLVSLAANAWLLRRVFEQFLVIQEARLDPVGLAQYPLAAEAKPTAAHERRVVFFGDSRAHAWTSAAQLPGFDLMDRGIGRETSAQARERFERHVAPLDPAVVVIQVGVNDLKLVSLRPELRSQIVDACAENIEAIVAIAQALGAGVVLSTIFPVGELPPFLRPFSSGGTPEAIEAVNERLRALAGPRVVVLDAATLLSDPQGGITPGYAHDWLHIAPAGYAALNGELVRAVKGVSGPGRSVEKLP